MTASVLSTDTALIYSEFIWWRLHHSDDRERLAMMLGSYYDESAVDGSGPVSAVGGLLLKHANYTWLGIEWNEAVSRSGIAQSFVHMKDFGEHGGLAAFPISRKRDLMAVLAKIINEHKYISIGSTLTPEEYTRQHSFLKKAKKGRKYKEEEDERPSIHSMCFLQAAIVQGKMAEAVEYGYDIPFMLDEGCPDRECIDRAHYDLKNYFPGRYRQEYGFPPKTHAGGLTWEDDKQLPALQAADVIVWAVRRKAANLPFNDGTEPLEEILSAHHVDQHYPEAWMVEACANLRARLGR
jgi:Protein of unknown function (DUF3800)